MILNHWRWRCYVCGFVFHLLEAGLGLHSAGKPWSNWLRKWEEVERWHSATIASQSSSNPNSNFSLEPSSLWHIELYWQVVMRHDDNDKISPALWHGDMTKVIRRWAGQIGDIGQQRDSQPQDENQFRVYFIILIKSDTGDRDTQSDVLYLFWNWFESEYVFCLHDH